MNFVKKKVFFEVFSKEDFMTLKLLDIPDAKFRKKLRFMQKMGISHKSLKWNTFLAVYLQSFIDIEKDIDNILSSGICSSGGKMLFMWGNLLQTLLPKVQQAIQDCQNNSWDWVDIKF